MNVFHLTPLMTANAMNYKNKNIKIKAFPRKEEGGYIDSHSGLAGKTVYSLTY
ncbi:hypothetical protein [Hydrogenovibrio sp. SC-1]|uniref:hypothetical protein n=1 Tax=Hydrogenovibrio sp. SC-1 TaxID=2065820 RepID=UPI0013041CA1|nr:hypothetical protein [Hydrogenovibrio sp. SC-1]